ncbi:MAG: metallophosphoesterase [Polyangiaceae bacterium]|jgi:hypothetical protein|nr:metallophosphoesterase [Polyangiaceae bacterium]
MPRTVIVGDVHACLDELRELLDRAGLCHSDRLYFVGDLVGRGPDSQGVLALVRQLKAISVRGNHEHKMLAFRAAQLAGRNDVMLGPSHFALARSMREADWDLLRAMPLWHDLDEHGLRIVHAGVLPGVPVEATDPNVLMTVRALTPRGQPVSVRAGDPWGRRYVGPPHVVFGHNALMRPQFHSWSTGIDMGCVYGGFLAAIVLDAGQPVPPLQDRQDVIISVPARRTYYPIRIRRERVSSKVSKSRS